MPPPGTGISNLLDDDLVAHYERLAGEVDKSYRALINDTLRTAAGLAVADCATEDAQANASAAPRSPSAQGSKREKSAEELSLDYRNAVFAALISQQQEIEKLANQQQELFAAMQGMFFPDNLAGAANMVSLGIEQLRQLSGAAAPVQTTVETKK